MEIQFGFLPQALPLVLARTAALTGSVSFFGSNIPTTLRAVMALVLTLAMIPAVSPEWAEIAKQIHTFPEFLLAVLNEVLIGLGVGLLCNIFMGAALFGGTLAGTESSLMMSQAIDPASGISSTLLSTAMETVFLLLVLLTNGHLVLLKFMAASFTPMNSHLAWLNSDVYTLIVSAGSFMFEWGLKIALPLVAMSLITNACLGLITRMAPDFDVLFLALPVRLGLGICVFGLVIRCSGGMFEKLIRQMLTCCNQLLFG